MGTRNLTVVCLDGEYKIAQYGQWDGYPSGNGYAILKFIRRNRKNNFNKFKEKLRKCTFMTDEDIDTLQKHIDKTCKDNWPDVYPHLSRDAGAGILDMVLNSVNGLQLKNSIDFAADSLFCEWAYVIDLDNNALEVYKGFNKTPVPDGERFSKMDKDGEYYPIRLLKVYPLDKLPPNNLTFNKQLTKLAEK